VPADLHPPVGHYTFTLNGIGQLPYPIDAPVFWYADQSDIGAAILRNNRAQFTFNQDYPDVHTMGRCRHDPTIGGLSDYETASLVQEGVNLENLGRMGTT
jgi:hypothetical protein